MEYLSNFRVGEGGMGYGVRTLGSITCHHTYSIPFFLVWAAGRRAFGGTVQFSSFPSLSHVGPFVTQWTAACQASLSIANSWSLLKLMSLELMMPSNHLTLCHPLFSCPLSFPVFPNESVCHISWPNYSSFCFRFSLFKEYPGLISFRID